MPGNPVELILLRQWASYMSFPIWLMDGSGNLVYYNEPAEPLLGREFSLAGEIRADELAHMFVTTHGDGSPLPADELPVVIALLHRRPSHGVVRFTGLDGAVRVVDVTALPIERPDGEMLGVVAIFWASPGE